MAARIARSGRVYQLDRPAEPTELVSEEDAKDTAKLARLLIRILSDLASIKRRFFPRWVDFEDRDVVSGDVMRLTHDFGGRVRYWVVDWRPATPGDVAAFDRNEDTDEKTLLLNVGNTGMVTMRVEAAG